MTWFVGMHDRQRRTEGHLHDVSCWQAWAAERQKALQEPSSSSMVCLDSFAVYHEGMDLFIMFFVGKRGPQRRTEGTSTLLVFFAGMDGRGGRSNRVAWPDWRHKQQRTDQPMMHFVALFHKVLPSH